jgi:hypothetical protein
MFATSDSNEAESQGELSGGYPGANGRAASGRCFQNLLPTRIQMGWLRRKGGRATAVAGFSCSEWPEVQHEDDCSNNGNLHKED